MNLHWNWLQSFNFERLTNLTSLDLSRNELKTIESHNVPYLTKLVYLDLSVNSHLHGPTVFLRHLSSLQTLSIDSWNQDIARGISELKKLEHLAIRTMQAVSKKDVLQLQNTSVTYLRIYYELEQIDRGAFSSWKALVSLELHIVGDVDVFKALSGLQAERLYITFSFSPGTIDFDGFEAPNLSALAFHHAKQEELSFKSFDVPTLQWLDISHNSITSLDPSVGFQTLQWLDISHNRITSLDLSFGVHKLQWLNASYNIISELDMSKMQTLYNLDISHQEQCFSTKKTLPRSLTYVNVSGTQLCSQESICLFHVEFVNQRSKMLTEFFKAHFFDYAKPHLLKDIYNLLNLLHLSPTTDVDADVNLRKIEDFIVESNCTNTTEKVDIRYLDLRDNDIKCVYPSVFNQYDWSDLNILDLSHNKLGSVSYVHTNASHFWDFLMPLWNLTDLYLDSNHLQYVLQPNMLLNQTNLQSLHLSQTKLTNLTLKMGRLTDLQLLDISNNAIQCLYTSEMRDISKIIHQTPERRNLSKLFELNLSDNLLHCSCSCFPFYLWMRNVRPYINFTDFSSYRCKFDNGTSTDLSDLNLIVAILHSQCLPRDWSPVISAATTILITYSLILIATTSFRFRHTLKYIWLKHKMHREYLERHILDPKYRFDAFVSCERTDTNWVKTNLLPELENEQTGLKFCIAQRDFLAGVTIIDNIVRSIHQSRKVVCIISQNFLKSGWCQEELLMGHHESLSRGKNLLICVFMQDITYNKLPDRFKFILSEMTCIKWPRDQAAQQVFCIMLQRALLDGQPNRNEV